MKKETKLLKKLECLLKKLNCREYLHHFGPKKYKFKQHAIALLLKEVCRMSFRRLTNFFSYFGFAIPTYSALCKSRKRIPLFLWQKILKLTTDLSSTNVAIDSTGFSKTNPSFYFVKRIDRKKPIKSYAKLSAFFDIDSRKFCALKIRAKPRHDVRDVKSLLRQNSKFQKLFGDSAYDSEWLYETCFDKKIKTIIKPKKNAKKGFYRRKQQKNYSDEEYPQRSLIESGFGSLKRKYGGDVSGRCAKAIKVEINCKAIAHNLSLYNLRFSTEPIRKVYNDKYSEYLLNEYGESAFYWTLYNHIVTEDEQIVPVNSLGLDKLYVLTSGNSASASELLINCLKPYIDVVIIGTTTYGKNVGSITVKDIDQNGNINPDHKWAMQPIISQSSNVNYESEYYNGFDPDYYVAEDLTDLLPLGDENELLLKSALDIIKGIKPAKDERLPPGYAVFFNSEYFDRSSFEMIDDLFRQ